MISTFVTALACAAALPHPAPPPVTAGYALVVTNNRSHDTSRPDLHYADDDGVKYAQLFSESLGVGHVTLLTTLDPESAKMYPTWRDRAAAPTRGNLDLAVASLAAHIAEHPGVPVFIVFAGHGDIDHGKGFIELEDGRFTSGDLDTALLAKLTAARVHLILDSCNSYFMINPRKPGMKRWENNAPVSKSLLDTYPNVGAIISTSSEAATYEWSELQSGIFSYELRSAMRGAADANTDGVVSYNEIEAFITVANQALVNDLYRPKVFARAPSSAPQAPLMGRFAGTTRVLTAAAAGNMRLTVRDRNGVRLLDANKENGTSLRLNLPVDDSMEVEETDRTAPGARPEVIRRPIPSTLANSFLQLDSLMPTPARVAARGEAPVFRDLFAAPFGQAAVATYKPPTAVDEVAFGVNAQDVRRLELHLKMAADMQRDSRLLTGTILYTPVAAAMLVTGGELAFNRNNLSSNDQIFAGITLGLEAGIVGLGAWLTFSEDGVERIQDAYQAADKLTEAQRAQAVLKAESALYSQVRWLRVRRWIIGGVFVTLGASMLVNQVAAGWGGTGDGIRLGSDHLILPAVLNLSLASAIIIDGIYYAVLHRDPVERVWDLYVDQRESFGSNMPPQPFSNLPVQVSVAPLGGPQGGAALMLGGRF